jgi:hypothetical protein
LCGGLTRDFVSAILVDANADTFIPEIVVLVVRYLKVPRVEHAEVTVVDYSSKATSYEGSSYSFDPKCTLELGTDSCWISGQRSTASEPTADGDSASGATAHGGSFSGADPGGEWLVYSLVGAGAGAGEHSMRRIYGVAMSIPVLPHGPLSVRHFVLETSNGTRSGTDGSGVSDAIASPSSSFGPFQWERHPQHTFVTLDERGLQQFAVVPPIEAAFVRLVCLSSASSMCPTSIGFWEIRFS